MGSFLPPHLRIPSFHMWKLIYLYKVLSWVCSSFFFSLLDIWWRASIYNWWLMCPWILYVVSIHLPPKCSSQLLSSKKEIPIKGKLFREVGLLHKTSVSEVGTKWHSLEASEAGALSEPFPWQTKQGSISGDQASGDVENFVLHSCVLPSSEKQTACLAVLQQSFDKWIESTYSLSFRR